VLIQFGGNYPEQRWLNLIYEEMVTGKKSYSSGFRSLLTPSLERITRHLIIVQAAESRDRTSKRRLLQIGVSLYDLEVGTQQGQHELP
jgi:hypothetical protein